MTHRLSTDYAKNCCNHTLIVLVIVEYVATCFFWDTLYKMSLTNANNLKLTK